MLARGFRYLHTGALLAASVSRAHIWAAISNVEIIQSPSLLFVKRCLLEPTEPCGWRPEDINQSHRRSKVKINDIAGN